jgi:hypothetical protein
VNPTKDGMSKIEWLRRYGVKVSVILLGAVATALQISAADLGALYEYVHSLLPHAVPPFTLQLLGIARHSDSPKPGLPPFVSNMRDR